MPSSLSSSECSETAGDEPAPPAECLYAENPPLLHGKLQDMSGSNQWNDWRWQMRNRIRNAAQLVEYFPRMHISPGLVQAGEKFPMAITPYYASLVEKFDSSDPIFQMSVPQIQELCDPPHLRDDPLEEDEDMPVPGLVHRYPDRALLIATTTCSTYCRHCTRKRLAGSRETSISSRRLKQVTAFLQSHGEIHDVIVSGGDPLTMATESLEGVLAALRAVETVEIIRIGTRVPVTMPMRITDELTAMLRKYHPIWINTHFNHPRELTAASRAACVRLVDAGIPLGNQTVLLRGVNDCPEIIADLCRRLIRSRVRPYYLFQCDLVRGVEHFRTPLARGLEIMEYLRGRLSGLAIPTFVVDAPHGGGKIPLLPNYIISTSPTHTVLRNSEGLLVTYPEPNAYNEDSPGPSHQSASSVWELACGKASKIQPSSSARQKRRLNKPSILEESKQID